MLSIYKMPTKFVASLSAVTMLVGLFISPTVTQANTLEAEVVSISGQTQNVIEMRPGERKEIKVEFLNKGGMTWKNDGRGYISLYTHDPKYRRSSFDPGTWIWSDQVKRIEQSSVAPGGKATMSFELHAPQKEGDYLEVFHLASEDTAWIRGGELKLNIRVAEESAVLKESSVETPVATGLSGEIAVKSANQLKVAAGRSILFTVGVKNTGSTTWDTYGLQSPDVAFSHPSWTGTSIASVRGNSVAPGEIAIVSFAFTAPANNGTYKTGFGFEANGVVVPGVRVEVPVEVIDGAKVAPVQAPQVQEAQDLQGVQYIDEPVIRVGTLIVDDETEDKVVITSEQSAFEVQDLEGAVLVSLTPMQSVTAWFANGQYYYDVGQGPRASASAIRFVPMVDHAVMKVTNFDRRVTRNAREPDNEFRNVLELRHNTARNRVWLINELNIEYYLRGLAETTDASPMEYQKTMITAARTFAYYHMLRNTRSAEHMHVMAYSHDQVYNGYGREKLSPRVTQAVAETQGHIVKYGDQIALTAYFSRSNGSTRDGSAVWGGAMPWAKAVSVPCDAGKAMWGHGVGISMSGAICFANDGMTWEQILNHFYTDIQIEKLWK